MTGLTALKFAPPLLLVLAVLFHQPLLTGLGDWLAPSGDREGEAVVVEGTQVALAGGVQPALGLLKEGKAKRLYLVLHLFSGDQSLFAIQEDYAGALGRELERLGLTKNQYRVLPVPMKGHPITLTEARHIVPVLGKEGIRKAVLLTEGFHARRSLRVYQKLGGTQGIKFTPFPYFPAYPKEQWWKHPEGVKDLTAESAKLVYYLLKGYL